MWSVLLAACAPATTSGGDPCQVSGNLCTWMGVPGEAQLSGEATDRLATWLYLPVDLAFGPDGTGYLSDYNHHRLRQVDPDGLVTTVSGTGLQGAPGGDCWEGCDALPYAWDHPADVLVDPIDPQRLWVASTQLHQVASVDLAASVVTWWAGSGEEGHADGPAQQALFSRPSSVVADGDGTLYVGDPGNHVIRRISPEGEVSTLAGEPGLPGYHGDGGPAEQAHLRAGEHGSGLKLALDGRRLLVADSDNGVIRAIDLDTGIIETVVGRYEPAEPDRLANPATGGQVLEEPPAVPGYAGDGGDALDALLAQPQDVAVGPDGALYIADTGNHCVRVVRDGVIETFAGTCTADGFAGDGAPAAQAQLQYPYGLALDGQGAVYVADTMNHVFRRVAP
jgi:sugar lactone lactonase YvrE